MLIKQAEQQPELTPALVKRIVSFESVTYLFVQFYEPIGKDSLSACQKFRLQNLNTLVRVDDVVKHAVMNHLCNFNGAECCQREITAASKKIVSHCFANNVYLLNKFV